MLLLLILLAIVAVIAMSVVFVRVVSWFAPEQAPPRPVSDRNENPLPYAVPQYDSPKTYGGTPVMGTFKSAPYVVPVDDADVDPFEPIDIVRDITIPIIVAEEIAQDYQPMYVPEQSPYVPDPTPPAPEPAYVPDPTPSFDPAPTGSFDPGPSSSWDSGSSSSFDSGSSSFDSGSSSSFDTGSSGGGGW